MQAIPPVDVHVENEPNKLSKTQKKTKISTRKDRQAPRMRTRVIDQTKAKKIKSLLTPQPRIPKQVVMPKLVIPVRSRSSSPNRGPWVPPPGRSTKGQNHSWQSPRSRLEINPVTEILIDDDQSWSSAPNKHLVSVNSAANALSTSENEKIVGEIQSYEKRIQGLIDGVGMLKDLVRNQGSLEKTDQCHADICSSLNELERLEKNCAQRLSIPKAKLTRSKSLSPVRSYDNSGDAHEPRRRRTNAPRVTFQDEPVVERRRARSATPTPGPIYLNPDRERLLMKLTDAEADIGQITNMLSSLKDILRKIKIEDKTLSFEVEKLYQQRDELQHMIERFERSNRDLKEYLRHQYHLEAEHGIIYDKNNTLKMRIDELETRNKHLQRTLADRENDNIALQSELERIRSQSVGFDTMKTSLENNRAHLQRELYAKEGEIHRLQCALRSLERDLPRNRSHFNHLQKSIRSKSRDAMCSYSSPSNPIDNSQAITIERLQAELNNRDQQIHDLKRKLYDNKFDGKDDTNAEITYLRSKLEQAEKIAADYKAQLHTQTLQASANHSKSHLSEVELEKVRLRLQKRIEELEPLPELLKQAEKDNENLLRYNSELEQRLSRPSIVQPQTPSSGRTNDRYLLPNDDIRALQRKAASLETQNEKLSRMVNGKDETPRPTQGYFPSNGNFNVEQQIGSLRLDYAQLKREKDQLERNFTSQMNELRQKLDQSSMANRSMQHYINSLKSAYKHIFNETLPVSPTRYSAT